jgi:hypothetical protein
VDIPGEHASIGGVDVKAGVQVEEVAEVVIVVDGGVNLHNKCRFVDVNVTLR